MNFMNGIGYVLRDYQLEIINSVISNIVNNNKMQTILLPNAGGKTSLSFILAIMFNEQGKRVMYYTDENLDPHYAADVIRTGIKRFNGIDFGNTENIKKCYDTHYDIIITDAIRAVFSADVLNDFSNNVRNADIDRIDSLGDMASVTQKSLRGLYFLQKMVERDDSFVISFDLNEMEDIGYAPIIASPHVLTYKMSREQQIEYGWEYGWSCANEYDVVLKKKMQVIAKQERTGAEIHRYDATLDLLLEKIDTSSALIEAKLDKLQNDISKLQNDVSQILSTVNEMNETVKNSKNIMSLYFSVHDEDDLEANLFISKIVDKMTSELSDKLAYFESQKKYQQVRKLVMVRLGDEAWGKLDSESQKFLATAKFMFMENMDLSEDIDYSGICLLSSKAFEVELSKRFVTEYEKYLSYKGFAESRWPKGIMVYNKRRGCYEKMRIEDFTLGSCPYIVGILGNDNDKRINQQQFEMYCKERLFKSLPQQEIRKKIKEFDGYIKNVKDNYRNPAAHKSTMTMSEASDCLDYILEIERVLKIMLEQFAF